MNPDELELYRRDLDLRRSLDLAGQPAADVVRPLTGYERARIALAVLCATRPNPLAYPGETRAKALALVRKALGVDDSDA